MKGKGGKHLVEKKGKKPAAKVKEEKLFEEGEIFGTADAEEAAYETEPAEEAEVFEGESVKPEVEDLVEKGRKPSFSEYMAAKKAARKAGVKGKAKRGVLIGIGAVVLVLALLVGTVYFFVDSKLNKITYGGIEDTPMKTGAAFEVIPDDYEFNTDGLEVKDSGSALPTDDVFADENVINILLLGTDMRIPNTNDLGRCDATMICSLNKKTGDIKLVGFERTIGVPVPGYEDENLSYVFQYGAGEFMQETINKCFLVDLAGYVHVSYEMFPKVIDAMGGIEVELDQSEVYHMQQYLAYDSAKDSLHTGLCHLNGTAAYSFCRLRDPDDDWGRQERLREAVMAMVKKLKTLSVKDINNMANEILPMISTNLSKEQIKSLIAMSPKFITAEVGQIMIPEKEGSWTYITGRGAHMLGCDFETESKKIKEFLYQ